MPGSVKNDWNHYLNGGTSQYNFAYNSEIPPIVSEPINVATNIKAASYNKKNNPVISGQNGGKRKSRYKCSQRYRRRTRRK